MIASCRLTIIQNPLLYKKDTYRHTESQNGVKKVLFVLDNLFSLHTGYVLSKKDDIKIILL